MKEYLDDVKAIMEVCAAFGKPVSFKSEPDAWNFWMLMYADKTHDATKAAAAVNSSGHPDAAGLPDTVAGFAQALIRLRDRYAPKNVYMGLCAFDFRASRNPQHTVTWVNSMDAAWDILFECSVAKYSTGGDGWWDAFDEGAQKRYLNWLGTVTTGTGLKYLQWQLIIGPSDYGLLPNFPAEERVSGLIASGCVGALFDLFKLEGPPHSQQQHGSTAVPPPEHPGYSSVGALANRLGAYYRNPLRWKKEIKKKQKKARKPIILPDGTEIIIVGGIPVRRRRKDAPEGAGKSSDETTGAKKAKPARAGVPKRPPKPEPEKPKETEEPPELTKLFREAESLFIDGDSEGAAAIFREIVAEHPGTPSAAKAAEYLDIVE